MRQGLKHDPWNMDGHERLTLERNYGEYVGMGDERVFLPGMSMMMIMVGLDGSCVGTWEEYQSQVGRLYDD